jgi:hypothetical protein
MESLGRTDGTDAPKRLRVDEPTKVQSAAFFAITEIRDDLGVHI